MSLVEDDVKWLKRGRQGAAIVRVLHRPMTARETCRAAHPMNPHIQLRDVWSIMRQLWERGLAVCLNPRHTTGKLYALTERGRQVAEQAFGVKVEPVSARVDWKRYGQVVRAKVRKLVLLELRKLPPDSIKTATVIRKRVCEKHLIGLNPTMRALKELEQLGLVRLRPLGARDVRKTDELTRRGAAIVRQLEK